MCCRVPCPRVETPTGFSCTRKDLPRGPDVQILRVVQVAHELDSHKRKTFI